MINMKKFNGQAIINFTLSETDVDDIMVAALEGGISYWCRAAEVVGDYLGEYASEQISRGGKLKLHEVDDDAVYELDIEKFIQGFKLWIENGDDEYGAVKADGSVDVYKIDAEMADMIIQYAIFDEVVFG